MDYKRGMKDSLLEVACVILGGEKKIFNVSLRSS